MAPEGTRGKKSRRFGHWLVRTVGYEAILLSERRAIHRHTAEALEAGGGRGGAGAACAENVAGAILLAVSRFEDGIEAFARADALVGGVSGPAAGLLRGEALEGRARALRLIGRYEEALAVSAEALDVCRACRDDR